MDLLSSSHLSSVACADLFMMLISNFKEDLHLDFVYLIVHLLKNLGQDKLIVNPSHMELFLNKMLELDDSNILESALTILSMSLAGTNFATEDKIFLVRISPRVISLTNHSELSVKQLAGAVNSMISKVLESGFVENQTENKYATVFEDLSSTKPYERALGLFRISNLIRSKEIEIP